MTKQFLESAREVIDGLIENRKPLNDLEYALEQLVREKGRLFILGVGGSAANASHAVADFRNLCGIEAYAPTDNVSELTARTNDEGFENIFSEWLLTSKLSKKDMVLVFSVGGGDKLRKGSLPLVKALDYAKRRGAKVAAIVGRDGGYAGKVADICILIPTVRPLLVTPFVESFQVLIFHMLVFHPSLQVKVGKWEGIQGQEL